VVEVQLGYEVTEIVPWNAPRQEIKRVPDLNFLVRMLHRPRLGTPYPKIIEQVQAIMEDLPLEQANWPYDEKNTPRKPMLVWDATGLGTPIVQNARQEQVMRSSIGLTITSGNVASMTGTKWHVPKALLVGELRFAMHRKRLQIAQGFRERETLEEELRASAARVSPSRRASFEAQEGHHDDTVFEPEYGCRGSEIAVWRRNEADAGDRTLSPTYAKECAGQQKTCGIIVLPGAQPKKDRAGA
jgi:hypothetical protein